jgi:hypothetical protein
MLGSAVVSTFRCVLKVCFTRKTIKLTLFLVFFNGFDVLVFKKKQKKNYFDAFLSAKYF